MTPANAWSRVPTLAPILEGAVRGLRRMPLVVVAGAVATVAAVLLVERIGTEQHVAAVLWSAILGIPLFAALRVVAGRYGWRAPVGWVPDALAVVALIGFAVAWTRWSEPVQAGRVIQLLAVFALLLAVAPYLRGPEGHGFWAYNRALLERLVLAVFFALVLFAGAAIALAALDNLFGVDVASTAYGRLWFVAILFLAPWFFVAGIPADFAALEHEPVYPRGLRVFTRFVLLPIVALYLLILLAYFGKVLITWAWPSGWIGWLVSAVAAAGISSLVLAHPLAARPGDRWVGTYARAFYALLLPAIVMLWLAIWQRVQQYGITERRYFLIVLSLWLAGIAVYQLVTRARGIRIIPLSLAVGALLTVAGPWGAYAVSEGSQVGRLAGLLERNGLLVDGRAMPATAEVPAADRREISAVLRYLAQTHGLDAIAGWFGDQLAEIDTRPAADGRWRLGDERARRITAWLNVEYVSAWQGGPTQWFAYAVSAGDVALAAAPYDSILFVRRGGSTSGAGLRAEPARDGLWVGIYRDSSLIGRLPLDSMLAELRREPRIQGRWNDIPADRLRLSRDSAGMRFTLQLFSVGGQWTNDSLIVSEFSGIVLVGRR
jgi:hypothetical protein